MTGRAKAVNKVGTDENIWPTKNNRQEDEECWVLLVGYMCNRWGHNLDEGCSERIEGLLDLLQVVVQEFAPDRKAGTPCHRRFDGEEEVVVGDTHTGIWFRKLEGFADMLLLAQSWREGMVQAASGITCCSPT